MSFVLKKLVGFKNFLYDQKIMKSNDLSVPVISVGNITFGGTGKTAVIDFLIQYYQSLGKKVGVISRGYKGTYKGVKEVLLNEPQSLFGDEPYMLKEKHPDCPIVLCRDRREAYKAILHKDVEIVLADDAFQHRKLARSLDIVVFDIFEDVSNYEFPPLGRFRESFSALNRADLVIFNKVNLLDKGMLKYIWPYYEENLVSKYDVKKGYFFGGYKVTSLLHKGQRLSFSDIEGQNLILVSGIGNSKGFENIILQNTKNPTYHYPYPDHYDYTPKNVKILTEAMKEQDSNIIITTQKDSVKLKKYKELEDFLYITQLEFEIDPDLEEKTSSYDGIEKIQRKDAFYEVLSRIFS